MKDFPAAHSMDTAWFAIDNDGNVAMFSTGESGCVPEDAYLEDAYPMEDEVRALPANGFKFDPDGFAETEWSAHVDIDDPGEGVAVFMFLNDLVPVKDLLARLAAEELSATKGTCVQLNVTDLAAFSELHARQACAGCYRDYSSREDIAAHGIYRYEHTCENWIAGPYARTTVPAQPLRVEQIPQSIRDAAVAFDGKFSETPKLQPAEHWPCQSWESGWLSSDGKTARPFEEGSGDWDNYADQRAEVDEGGIKFVNEPLERPTAPKKRWW